MIDERGKAVYNMGAEKFAQGIAQLVAAGAGIVGGCCGTTSEYIQKIRSALAPC